MRIPFWLMIVLIVVILILLRNRGSKKKVNAGEKTVEVTIPGTSSM